jgi:hypothetical protein
MDISELITVPTSVIRISRTIKVLFPAIQIGRNVAAEERKQK